MSDRRARVTGLAIALVAVLAAGGCKDDRKLKVSGFEPKEGDFNGGTTVHVTGNGFQLDGSPIAVKVFFGDRQALVNRSDGDGDLYVTAPGGKKGESVDVLFIFQPGGEKEFKVKDGMGFKYVEPATTNVDDLGGK